MPCSSPAWAAAQFPRPGWSPITIAARLTGWASRSLGFTWLAIRSPGFIRARHEASERRLKELSNSVTEQEKPERREDLQRYQRTWLARRDAGAQEFSMTGPKSERADRRLVYLADANEARLRELEYHLSTLR